MPGDLTARARHGFRGHTLVRRDDGTWSCTCGRSMSGGPLGNGRRGARDLMHFHRLDLALEERRREEEPDARPAAGSPGPSATARTRSSAGASAASSGTTTRRVGLMSDLVSDALGLFCAFAAAAVIEILGRRPPASAVGLAHPSRSSDIR